MPWSPGSTGGIGGSCIPSEKADVPADFAMAASRPHRSSSHPARRKADDRNLDQSICMSHRRLGVPGDRFRAAGVVALRPKGDIEQIDLIA